MLGTRTQYVLSDQDIYSLYVRFQNEALSDAVADCVNDRELVADYQQRYAVVPQAEFVSSFWALPSEQRLDYLQELIEGYGTAIVKRPVVCQSQEASFQDRLRQQKMTSGNRIAAYLD